MRRSAITTISGQTLATAARQWVLSIAAMLAVVCVATVSAQPADTASIAPTDSAKTNAGAGANAKDSLQRELLSLRVGTPLGSVVSPMQKGGYQLLSNREMAWQTYFTPTDLLRPYLPAFLLSQGAPGLRRGFSILGAAPDAISTSFNGRPLRDLERDAMEIEFYPAEFAERMEVLSGARALLYGSGESLMGVNMVAPAFDVVGSYARVWYIQGPNNSSGADLTFARNLSATTNLNLGFRRMPSDGAYDNQDVSGWSARGTVRWQPSAELGFAVSELFTSHTHSANGGLASGSSFSPQSLNTVVQHAELQDQTIRHDLTLSAQWNPLLRQGPQQSLSDGKSGGGTTGDTITQFDASLYYSFAERSLLIADTLAPVDTLEDQPAMMRRDLVGGRISARLPLAFALIEANGVAEVQGNGKLYLEAGGMLSLNLSDVAEASGTAKIHRSRGGDYFSLAGEGNIQLGDSVRLFGSYRQSIELNNTPAQRVWAIPDSNRASSQWFTSSFLEAGTELRVGGFWLRGAAYLRRATPRAGNATLASHTITAADVRASIPLSFLRLNLHLLASLLPDDDKRFPAFDGSGDLYGEFNLVEGNLNLRVGTTLEFQTELQGGEYEVISGEFIAPRNPARPAEQLYPNWGVYARARLGDAYLRAELRNILDAEYWSLYRYPIWERGIYLSVTWALAD